MLERFGSLQETRSKLGGLVAVQFDEARSQTYRRKEGEEALFLEVHDGYTRMSDVCKPTMYSHAYEST